MPRRISMTSVTVHQGLDADVCYANEGEYDNASLTADMDRKTSVPNGKALYFTLRRKRKTGESWVCFDLDQLIPGPRFAVESRCLRVAEQAIAKLQERKRQNHGRLPGIEFGKEYSYGDVCH